MPTFPNDACYLMPGTYAACIEFRTDEHHRRAFNASQLIEFSLEPNADADADKNEPPQKITLVFSTADVVILGWRLGLIANYLRGNTLAAVCILPKRYAELERNAIYVSSIKITKLADKS